MAIKPAINPGVAVAERPATLSGAMNFISGGQTLGTSIVASAANKIVGFQRGAAAVAPKAPDLGSIINALSTSILSNVENKLQSVNQNIQQVIQNKFLSQLGEYQKRIQEVTSNTPNKILENFLSLYKEAIGYIQFLGNRKNIKRLGDNLQALQNVFSETFKIAALVRSTILKIVGQLSNLPTASGGPGGLNLDINVPGGPLRRTLPGGGGALKMLGMGAAVAGAGALGGKVVSGMMDIGGGVQADTTGVTSSIPTPLLDRFMEILNRFDKALQGFQAPKKAPSAPRAPSGTKPNENPGAPGATPNLTSTGSEGVIEYAKKAGFSEQFTAGLLTNISHESGGNPFAYNPNDNGQPSYGLFQFRAGRGDNMIKYLESNGIPDAKKIFTNPDDPRRKDPELQKKAMALQIKYFTEEEKDQATQQIKGVQKSTDLTAVQNAFFAGERFQGYDDPNSSRYRARAADIQKTYQELQKSGKMKSTATGGPGEDVQKLEAQIRASTDRSQGMKGLAGEVAKPAVPTDQQSNVSIVPIVMGSPQSNSTPSGSQMALPPVMSKSGTSVPFLSSSNDDNFFTILSKVVYNIVDG